MATSILLSSPFIGSLSCSSRIRCRQSTLNPGVSHVPGRFQCSLASHHGPHGMPHFPLSEEEKEERKKELLEEYRHLGDATQQEALLKTLQKEMKLGSWLVGQNEFSKALLHYDKVLAAADSKSAEYGDAGLQKAKCLQKLGREEDAKAVYQMLVHHHYPRVRHQANLALHGTEDAEGGGSGGHDWYLRQYMKSGMGWGSYVATGKEKRVESREEKLAMNVLPWTLVLMGPAIIAYFLLSHS